MRTPVLSREQRRRRLLEAGLEVFGTTGYRGSSVRRVCQFAGLDRARFYENFSSREDLLLAVHEMVQSDALWATRVALSRERTNPRERLRGAIGAYVDSVASDRRRARVSFAEIVGVSDRVEHRRDARRAEWRRFFREEVRAAAGADHEPPGGYEFAAIGFVGALSAMMRRWALEEDGASVDELTLALSRFLLVVIGMED